MDENAIWEKFALTTVQMALGFASWNFLLPFNIFPKSNSHPCDYLYKILTKISLEKKSMINF